MSEQIQVSISQDSVQQIIKAHVQSAVMNALKPHSEALVRELVEKSLLSKPENDYNRYKKDHEKITVLEDIVRRMIAEEAQLAIKEWAEGHRKEIAAELRKNIASQGFAKKWAMQMVEQMLNATIYNFKVEVQPHMKGRD